MIEFVVIAMMILALIWGVDGLMKTMTKNGGVVDNLEARETRYFKGVSAP